MFALRHGSINWSTAHCTWASATPPPHPWHFQFFRCLPAWRWRLLVSARNLERHQALLASISLFLSLSVVVAARKYLANLHGHAPCPALLCHRGAACITPTLTAALELQVASCKLPVACARPSCICTCLLIALAIFISSFFFILLSADFLYSLCVCVWGEGGGVTLSPG